MILAFALAIAAQPVSDVHAKPHALGAAWAAAPISDNCLAEVAAGSDEKLNARNRPLARSKAQTLAGIVAQIVDNGNEYVSLTAQSNEAEYAKARESHVQAVAMVIRDYPSCNFVRLYTNSAIVERANALLQSGQ